MKSLNELVCLQTQEMNQTIADRQRPRLNRSDIKQEGYV